MTLTAQEAMQELWGRLCPDCGPEDYLYILAYVLVVMDNHPSKGV